VEVVYCRSTKPQRLVHCHELWAGRFGVCLANQVGREEAAEKPFLEERLATREANEKMVLE
jgi:hypothetical protein